MRCLTDLGYVCGQVARIEASLTVYPFFCKQNLEYKGSHAGILSRFYNIAVDIGLRNLDFNLDTE